MAGDHHAGNAADHRKHHSRHDVGTLHTHGDHERLLRLLHLHDAAAPHTSQQRQRQCHNRDEDAKYAAVMEAAVNAAVDQKQQQQVHSHDRAGRHRAQEVALQRAEITGKLIALQLEIMHQASAGHQGRYAHAQREQPHHQGIHAVLHLSFDKISWFPPGSCGQWH